MKVTSRSVSRWPKIPLGAVGFVILWALLVVAARIMGRYTGAEPDLCLFHRITGEPCPTCGTTRGLLALARGAWRESFLWNPMTMTGGMLMSMVLLARVITARSLTFEFSRTEKRILAAIGLGLFAINWAWLAYSHP